MLGYRREREYGFSKYGLNIQTCHVADVKAALVLTSGAAPNRIDPKRRVKPCPPHLWAAVEEAVRHIHLRERVRA